MLLVAFVLSLTPSFVYAHYSLPEDLFSFPKWSVLFLNPLPIHPHDAAIFSTGRGTLPQFLGYAPPPPLEHNAVLSPDNDDQVLPATSLQFMRIGHDRAYLCHIPSPSPTPRHSADESTDFVAPSKAWQQIAALGGSCLYHRQGWFTYSYCHNLHVRQFRELAHSQPQTGIAVPEEDHDYESFTLGRSPTADLSDELILSEEAAQANHIEVARGARQRYLVQRWRDGTVCDKIGTQREIEIQFHCSTSTMDAIVFIKETSTCKYVLVINTPRLCGEPGFRSRAEHSEEAPVRCREIVDDPSTVDITTLSNSPFPRRTTAPNSLAGTEKALPKKAVKSEKRANKASDSNDDKISMLKKLLESMMHGSKKSKKEEISIVSVEQDENGQQYWVVEGDEDMLSKFNGDNTLDDEEDDDDSNGKPEESSQEGGHGEL